MNFQCLTRFGYGALIFFSGKYASKINLICWLFIWFLVNLQIWSITEWTKSHGHSRSHCKSGIHLVNHSCLRPKRIIITNYGSDSRSSTNYDSCYHHSKALEWQIYANNHHRCDAAVLRPSAVSFFTRTTKFTTVLANQTLSTLKLEDRSVYIRPRRLLSGRMKIPLGEKTDLLLSTPGLHTHRPHSKWNRTQQKPSMWVFLRQSLIWHQKWFCAHWWQSVFCSTSMLV